MKPPEGHEDTGVVKKSLKTMLIFIAFLFSGVLGFIFSWHQHSAASFTPEVKTIETYHYPALFVQQIKGDPKAGEKIFKEFCAACHSKNPAIDMNAPRMGDKVAWNMRKKQGMKTLLQATINGIGAMPARGGCFECSDEQLRMAVEYIIFNSD